MVTTDVELELGLQLKEAGKQLSNPPTSVDELLHILDQTEKLLSKVDQSPNNLMQEALSQPVKALVDGRLLKHSNVDVKVSVASCLCEITRITAPDAPYTDEEMKDVFQCIVSSFENLSDNTSRSYGKRASILETVSKVRSCVIMLDLECDDLIVKMFENFLNSVRDYHRENIFSLMANIMAVVLEESEDISFDMLKPLLTSIKNNNEEVLPVARKLGEEVIKKSADKLRVYLNKALTILGDSLDDYSQVLTSICKGTTCPVEHNVESGSVQPKADETRVAVASSDDAAQITSNGKMVTGNEGTSDDKESKKLEEAVEHPDSNQTSKLDTNDSVAEKSEDVEIKPENQKGNKSDTTTKSAEPSDSEKVHGEKKAEKSPDIAVSVPEPLESEVANAPSQSGGKQEQTEPENAGLESQSKSGVKKGIRSKKKSSSQTSAPSQRVGLTKVPEVMSDSEMSSPKRMRKKTPKAAASGSDVEPQKKSTKKLDTVDSGSKKESLGQDDAPSVDVPTKAPEGISDSEMRSPKRARKKTPKAATSGSDVEPVKKSTKKVDTVDSVSKKKNSGEDDAYSISDSEMKSPKRVRKKTPKAEDNKPSATSGLDVESLKKSSKKQDTVDTGPGVEPVDTSSKKAETVDSGSKPVKRPVKKVGGRSTVTKTRKVSGKKKSQPKKSKQVDKKDEETRSDAKPLKQSGKQGGKSQVIPKPSEDFSDKDEEMDSDDKPPKQTASVDEETDSDGKPPKQSASVHEETDSDGKPSKQSASVDEETDSDDKPPKQSPSVDDEETDSDEKPPKQSASVDEETDSENRPLMLSTKMGNKSSSVVKSSSKKKDGQKQGRGTQAKSSSEDDGMDMSLKLALKKVTKGKLEKAPSSTSKRKRSVGKDKVADTVEYGDSLVGQKVKVWWPKDKTYYEGTIASFDSAKKKHKVSYNDGDVEILNLKRQKWEIVQEISTQIEEQAVEDQTANIPPKSPIMKKPRTNAGQSTSKGKRKDSAKRGRAANLQRSASKSAGANKDKSRVDNKAKGLYSKDTSMESESVSTINSKEKEESKEGGKKPEELPKESGKKQEVEKIVYSRGRKGNKTKTKTAETEKKTDAMDSTEPKSPSHNVNEIINESEARDAAENRESVEEKSAETPQNGKKRKIAD